MKKIALIASIALAGVLALASCKKEYVCTCNDGNGNSFEYKFESKKAGAKAACDAWGIAYTSAGGSCTYK